MPAVTKSDVLRTRPSFHDSLEHSVGAERFARLCAPWTPSPKPPKQAPPKGPRPDATDKVILSALAAAGLIPGKETQRGTP